MSFRQSADGWVTGHLCDGVEIDGKQESLATHPGGRQGSFDAGVTGATNDDVVSFRENEHWTKLMRNSFREKRSVPRGTKKRTAKPDRPLANTTTYYPLLD